MTMAVNRKAISLMSGGLDSALATKLIMDQNVEVVGLHFTSPFASKREKDRGLQVVRTARELAISLITRDKGPEYLDLLRNPRYGYGKNMNPCIDCRIFMLRKTKAIMEEEGAGFVITGEVLGQRPMSQRRGTIELIEKSSGLEGLIVRPLSARLFPPSVPEMEGILDRNRLLNVAGRSRNVQYELVKSYGLKEFSCPGGGCLLTDPIFATKLRELFASDPEFTPLDIELLSIGRHFRLEDGEKLILGRNESENDRLESLWEGPYSMFQPIDFKGPTGLLKGEPTDRNLSVVAAIMGAYGKQETPFIHLAINRGAGQKVARKPAFDPDTLRI